MRGIENLEKSKIFKLEESIAYNRGGIISKRIYQKEAATSILFSVSAGEEIENNRVSGETLIIGLEGIVNVNIEGVLQKVSAGEIILIPSEKLYEISGDTDCKYQLIEIGY